MNIFAPLVRRPVGTSLLAIGLMLGGLWAYLLLGVAAFPSIEFPGVAVFAQMPGASAQTMASTVVAPLERHLGRIPGVRMMASSASEGGAQIQVIFNMDRGADKAARDVQAAINAAAPDLPPGLPSPPGYVKFDTSQIPVLLVSLTSSSLPPDQLYDLADTLLKPAVAQIAGVAQVQVGGGTPHAVRIVLDTRALVGMGVTANDVANALRAANVSSPQGTLSNGVTRMTVSASDALHTVPDFAALVVASRNGVPVRLADVATISGGQENKYAAAWFNGQRAVVMQINKRPEANAVATVQAVRARLPELRGLLPADATITPIFDFTPTTLSALHEVQVALLMGIVMVALVMLVFLRRLRPTVIAMLSVPLSLAGAFVAMWMLGFTLNIFSLVALVLCVGFVVDDAIVVIENIVRHMERGEPPLQAALKGVREIGFTVLSITLSLIAVFGPMVFGNNMFTMLMREFSVTLIATIVISALVSLTLTPALCGAWLAHEPSGARTAGRLERLAERFDSGMLRIYERALDWAMRHRRIMRWQPIILLVLTIGLAVVVVMTAGGGLMPKEDTGLLQASITADANVSPLLLSRRTQEVAAKVKADPAVRDVSAFLGGNNGGGAVGNQASLFVDLKPPGDRPGDRHVSSQAVVDRLDKVFKNVPDLDVSLSVNQFIGGGGGAGGGRGQYAFQLDSVDGVPLQQPTLKLARVMRGMKQFRNVSTSFDSIGKQQMLQVDRNAAARLHVSVAQVDTALANAFGQTPVSTIYSDINQYRVVITAESAESLSPATLLNTYVRNTQGKMIPLSALAQIRPHIAPVSISHFDQLESAAINYNLAKGVTQAEGLKLVEQAMFAAQLPPGVHKKYSGDNKNLVDAMNNALIMLLAVILVMYVVLGILYESLIHPLTILSTLPAAGMGAFLAMLVTHTQLTLMSVIAVLMLIGIVKKNAILMVDFALVAERDHGMSPPEAIREAALVRFRPITMTTLVAMGAALPLAVGFGYGSEMRQPLGIAILGGLFVSQLLTLLSTPAIYLWQHDHRERKAARRQLRAEIRRQRLVQQQMPALPK
ncbi:MULTISPECIES: efflux RND transporter permease subunit [Rhodanobacter]|uniref:efflux RND transporter permease subunit n=1 Tax=Rhodanobacter TaxID=75309 RepID=UPI000486F589|nr:MULTISPECIES: efflux RND transporter permease subunit [Rhodanobacter]KZC18827.1 acriflavin resistance protein [Rhodanobacter denitrificans]UJJ52803.1 efflux RND transporter permease subunit [Rhodanobacter denitrificans]UJJ60310.1 efflux RND transporter permease subunit [Rhodanobacter denitrificans]UJM95560.1 efflux RND transporter permease subunit [Rhodanobacter denitrificans]UJM99091.1 efflux RND transporter permease subunit [Rhodanobacter denitrificans]